MNSNDENLDIALLPGEHVVYKTRRRFAGMPIASWVVATNKRFLLANKLGLFSTYKSLFYNSISQVSVHKGVFGSKLVIVLSNAKAKSSIRFVKRVQALSIFGVLSNQVSMKGELSTLYESISNHNNDAMHEDMASKRMNEVVEEIEANSMVFAAMVKHTEQNALDRKLNFNNFMRRCDTDNGVSKNNTVVSSVTGKAAQNAASKASDSKYTSIESLSSAGFASKSAIPKSVIAPNLNGFVQIPARIEHKIDRVWNLYEKTISANATVESRDHTEGSSIPYVARQGKLDPDKDMLIFKKRDIKSRLFSD